MTRVIALTSAKGGAGKSSLAVNLAGALHEDGGAILVDEDRRIRSCLEWAVAGRLAFPVVEAEQVGQLPSPAFLVVDTEGRPALADMVVLTQEANVVLIPSGPSGLEIRSTLRLWDELADAGADLDRVRVIITKAPPVGTVGQQARDALREAGVTTCDTVVRAYAAHQRAAEIGVLVRDVRDERAGAAWADIKALAREVR